jgi:hypothetical protein
MLVDEDGRRRSGGGTLTSMALVGRCFPWLWSARARAREMGSGGSKEIVTEEIFQRIQYRRLHFFKTAWW